MNHCFLFIHFAHHVYKRGLKQLRDSDIIGKNIIELLRPTPSQHQGL